jgi:hypothetical protein
MALEWPDFEAEAKAKAKAKRKKKRDDEFIESDSDDYRTEKKKKRKECMYSNIDACWIRALNASKKWGFSSRSTFSVLSWMRLRTSATRKLVSEQPTSC